LLFIIQMSRQIAVQLIANELRLAGLQTKCLHILSSELQCPHYRASCKAIIVHNLDKRTKLAHVWKTHAMGTCVIGLLSTYTSFFIPSAFFTAGFMAFDWINKDSGIAIKELDNWSKMV